MSAIEQALLTQKKRLAQACRGNGEFGGWFNKFLKAGKIRVLPLKPV